ncbi:MAG: energy-coupling factor ABC transporter permease [Pseudomonadales bacterium]
MFSFSAHVTNGDVFYAFGALLALLLLGAIRCAPWRHVFANTGLQHLFAGAVVLLLVLWSIKAQLATGFEIHLLGITAVTLIIGWDLALIAGCLALGALSFLHGAELSSFTANAVLTLVLPIALTRVVARWVDSWQVNNFFVYLFVCGFFCAALNAAVIGAALSGLLWWTTDISWLAIDRDVITIIPLTLFPEGLLNGILLCAAMVFYPDWVRSFDAKRYIDDQ